MRELFWYQCSKLDFHSCSQAMWCWNSCPRCVISRGYTMHSDDNRCAIAKDFFNTNLELLQSVNYMPTSLLEFGTVGANIRFYGGYISVFLPCLRWLIAVWIPGVCWYQLGVIMGHLLRPCLTTYRVCDGWWLIFTGLFMNISNKLMLLFWTFESSEVVIFIIICDLWYVYLVEST